MSVLGENKWALAETVSTPGPTIWCARCRVPAPGVVSRVPIRSGVYWRFEIYCHGEKRIGGFEDRDADRARGKLVDRDAVFFVRTWALDDGVYLFEEDRWAKLFGLAPDGVDRMPMPSTNGGAT